MNPLPDTPALFLAVPGHTRLFRRIGGTYYLRAKVPYRLRNTLKKGEIVKSLKTKEYKEAVLLIKPESMRVDRLFMEAEAKIKGQKPAPAKLSREEIVWIVSDWFIKQEAENENWVEDENGLAALSRVEKREMLEEMITNTAALDAAPHCVPDDGSWYLNNFLNEEGNILGIEKGSDDYKSLLPVFRRAQVETFSRSIDRMRGKEIRPYDPRFATYFANTLLPPAPRQKVAFGKFLNDFMEYQRREHSNTTPAAYALAVRILRETIGDDTPMNTISRQHLDRVFEILRRVPVNMTQRYPGLTAEKAIEAAARAGDTRTLARRTLRNSYILIKAVFNYAEEEDFIKENPTKGRKHKDEFKTKRKKGAGRPPFTSEELQKIFHAPLYTGCKNDEAGYAKPGTEHPRRGRFWVPLVALFQGMRCNEVCQLYAEDISEENGVPFIHVRDDLDDEDETDKRLKNEGSRRKVPIHPEILKIGFRDYVDAVRKENGSGRLFPTLNPCKNTGRFSKPFSKWFARFVEQACGYKPKAVFHSFRHNFRAGLDKAKVQPSYVEMLGGWQPEGSSEIEYRHAELSDLRDAIALLSYPELDLSHLYKLPDCNRLQNMEAPKTICRVRRRPAPYSPLQSGAE